MSSFIARSVRVEGHELVGVHGPDDSGRFHARENPDVNTVLRLGLHLAPEGLLHE